MPVTLIIGAQWGDEGKGKVIDALSDSADFVVRFNGGNNAGHTVVNQYGTFPMHLIPSGIFSKKAIACITNGVVLDLEVLISEIAMLEKAGVQLKNRLYISPRCHIILPYHKTLDKLYEEAKGKTKTGTTGRGIGPVYADKVSYNGIRLYDLLESEKFKQKLEIQLNLKNKIIQVLSPQVDLFPYKKHRSVKNKVMQTLSEPPLQTEEILKKFATYKKQLLPYIVEPYPHLQKALKDKKNILMEGAQAMFLDNDWGTYPFVTASTIVSGGITASAGIPPRALTSAIGVTKAYATRVGSGPFPTELTDKTGDKLRKIGGEYGVTTGRPRRCGWFDAELIRFAAEINGLTSLAVTKLDVLDEFDEIKVCIGYKYKGKTVHYYDGDAEFLKEISPIYKTFKGWRSSTKGMKKFDQLPLNAKKYIAEIEKLVEVPIKYISTGKERNALIKR